MKNSISFIVLLVVTLCANATDRFYIEDFEIAPGETRTVNILLDNETVYTAFQTDIYMPEGLTIEQEDGDYIFDLTSRKANDHTIMSQLRPDGTIRIAVFSMNVKAIKGNSGAVITFNLIAADDYMGPATIELKNSIFTTVDGDEVIFANEICTLGPISTPGDVNNDGSVDIDDVTALIQYVLGGYSRNFDEVAANVDGEGSIDIDDVTALISMILLGH